MCTKMLLDLYVFRQTGGTQEHKQWSLGEDCLGYCQANTGRWHGETEFRCMHEGACSHALAQARFEAGGGTKKLLGAHRNAEIPTDDKLLEFVAPVDECHIPDRCHKGMQSRPHLGLSLASNPNFSLSSACRTSNGCVSCLPRYESVTWTPKGQIRQGTADREALRCSGQASARS